MPQIKGEPGLLQSNSTAGTSRCKRLEQMLWSRFPPPWSLEIVGSWKCAVCVDTCSHALTSVVFPFLLKVVQGQACRLLIPQDNQKCHMPLCVLATCFSSGCDCFHEGSRALLCRPLLWQLSKGKDIALSKAHYFGRRKNLHVEEHPHGKPHRASGGISGFMLIKDA